MDPAPLVDPEQAPPRRSAGRWAWAFAGAGYGVLIRFVLGALPPSQQAVMSLAFLVGTPLAVGAIAAYGAPDSRVSLLRAAIAPLLPMTLMLLGCAVTLLEGSICIAIMAPLFFGLAIVGGFLTGLTFRLTGGAKPALGLLGLSPFLLLPLDGAPLPDAFLELHESRVIAAAPETVWARILSAKNIQAGELPPSLVHLIGVPRPLDGENRVTGAGEVRFSRWERGVHFTATVVDRREFESITWRYAFAPDSFPAGSMDEHVVLGGRHLDLGDTTFNLHALPGGTTRLEVVGRYRLTTPINAYAVPVSRLLGRDFLQTLLGLYQARAERGADVARWNADHPR
jgi:hypothetical protein